MRATIGIDITDPNKYEKCRRRKDLSRGNGVVCTTRAIHILSAPYQFLKHDRAIFQPPLPFPPCTAAFHFFPSLNTPLKRALFPWHFCIRESTK